MYLLHDISRNFCGVLVAKHWSIRSIVGQNRLSSIHPKTDIFINDNKARYVQLFILKTHRKSAGVVI
jgi:hypothetical protein